MKHLRSLFTVPVLSIFGLALIVRVTYNFTVASGYFPLHDSLTYQTIAFNVLREHCYCLISHHATVDRAPLWPLLIAAVYGLLAPKELLVRLLLCVVGSGTCLLTYFFARDVFGRRIGLFAGLVAAIYPFLFVYDGWLYSESLYIFLLLAFCYTLYRLQHTGNPGLAILGGILLGLLSLTRPNGLLILASFLVWIAILGWAKILCWRDVFRGALLVSLISLALVAPWTLRNYVVTHTLIPVAIGDGKVFLGAYNYETADPVYQNGYYAGIWIIPTESTPWISDEFPKGCSGPCEVKRDNTYRYDALQWVESHPQAVPFLIGQHLVNLWQIVPQEADLAINRFPNRTSSQFVVLIMEIITPIVFALALLGLIVTSARWRDLLFIYFMIAITVVQGIVFYSIPRFRAPIEPLLILLAAGGVWWLVGLFSKRHNAKETTVETPAKAAVPVSSRSR